ncbi:MFS transporter [Sphingobium algorifonticola]|uniref:MFS transporter n=1 Tax=Sphingobium algorifonticola TaxID=2008318 RepID=A0A437JCG0_9SPHN|nr:MFS transporter [Sphingobium algorifonticola]RVT43577.1 MFS transporter [Sphingobium algorifonticola]
MASVPQPVHQPGQPRIGRHRWVVVALLFAATAINYVDRQMIGVLKPTLSAELQWSETDYANIVFWFQAAYAVGYLGFGRVVDLIGARMGYAVAVTVWTIAHVAHGGVYSVTQFAIARFGLGIGESGNFPAGIKAVTEWFPQKERAFAIGLFNAGANVGAIVTPLLVPWITLAYGWRMAFIVTGIFGVLWLIAWLVFYRSPADHRKVTQAELAYIQQDAADPVDPIGWRTLLTVRETWAYAIGKFCIDPIWWFFLFWLPGYLGSRYGLDLVSFGPPLVAIYILSDFGSVIGGWMSSRLIRAGRSVNVARKITMLVCALAVLPVFFAQSIDNLWVAVIVIGIATAAHQAFSANLYTLPSDLFPRAAVGSVVGIGGTVGAIGGMVMAKYAGFVLDGLGSYAPLFAVAASAYLVALLAVHLLSPRLARVDLSSG